MKFNTSFYIIDMLLLIDIDLDLDLLIGFMIDPDFIKSQCRQKMSFLQFKTDINRPFSV